MNDDKKAEASELTALHRALAEALSAGLRGDEVSPGLAEVARKFLADNGINCDLSALQNPEEVGKVLPFERPTPTPEEESENFG